MAVGVALSPIQIATVVSILLSSHVHRASAFLLGWSAGILAIGLLILFIPGLRMLNGDPTPLAGWLRIFLGVGLIVVAWRKWKHRPSTQQAAKPPRFMAKIEAFSPGKILALGIALSMLNPKVFVLTSASAMTIYESRLLPKEELVALIVYTAIASLSVFAPIAFVWLRRDKARRVLNDLEAWLLANNTAVTVSLLAVFAVLIIGGGLKLVF